MKNLLCLAMSLGLVVILYFYIKSRLYVIDTRLNTLTDIVHTLAKERAEKESNLKEIQGLPEYESDSETESDSDTDNDSNYETESEIEILEIKPEPKYVFNVETACFLEPKLEKVEPKVEPKVEVIHLESDYRPENQEPTESLIEVSDDESSVKHVQVELNDYSLLTLKELKQKVVDLGGPSLKTKKALIEFLEKKV
jgi:hypothetical protein